MQLPYYLLTVQAHFPGDSRPRTAVFEAQGCCARAHQGCPGKPESLDNGIMKLTATMPHSHFKQVFTVCMSVRACVVATVTCASANHAACLANSNLFVLEDQCKVCTNMLHHLTISAMQRLGHYIGLSVQTMQTKSKYVVS